MLQFSGRMNLGGSQLAGLYGLNGEKRGDKGNRGERGMKDRRGRSHNRSPINGIAWGRYLRGETAEVSADKEIRRCLIERGSENGSL